jgi:hypothetical protein
MDTIPGSEAIITTDVLGRVKTPAARREQLLDEFERSGLSGSKFAELAGIKYSTFATWGQKRRRARSTYAALKLTSFPFPCSPIRVKPPLTLAFSSHPELATLLATGK